MNGLRVLITGNMGYVGSVLVRHLRRAMPGATLIGYDAGFFAHCLTGARALPETQLDVQHFGDVRHLPAELLVGVDAIVHLAAISNDPMGAKFETATYDINQGASLRLAEMARDAGVKSFIFASSCSMYGAADGGAARKETDQTNPLTAYAKSKIGTELGLNQMPLGNMTVTCLRFATACGMSERLRLDLVLNDFVTCAVTSRLITVLSDGSPWRPLIDVSDMARAIEWAIARDRENGGALLAINVGKDEWNYQVKYLANAVAAAVPGTEVRINTSAPPDGRSYRVNFALFKKLAPSHQPQMTLDQSIGFLRQGLQAMAFTDSNFRSSSYMRLKMLEQHMSDGELQPDLRWSRGT
jgi:nucleoside-diphosphate-sugar epimerase